MQDVTSYEGIAVSLVCTIEGNYTFSSVQFWKDGIVLTGTPDINENKTVFTHILPNTSCADTGNYECAVTGSETNLSATADVTIEGHIFIM